MSGTTPPPPRPGDDEAANEATSDTVNFGDGSVPPYGGTPVEPADDSSRPGRAGKVVALSAALALLVGGGAFAFYQVDPLSLFRTGPQAAEALPGDSLLYVGLDLAPSASQKVNALRFLNHFPAFSDNVDLSDPDDDVRKAIFEDGIDAAGCDLSYADDVEPWLGEKFGFALIPADGDAADPDFVLAVETTDTGAAGDALAKFQDCAAADDGDYGYAESGDYMLVAETQDLADQFAADADDESLADTSAFADDMDALGDLGVATVWADIDGFADVYAGQFADLSGGAVSGSEGGLDLLKKQYQRAAATFRFDSDAVEVVTSVYGDTAEIDHGDNEIVDLPDSTVFAASESGGGSRLASSWDDIKGAMEAEGLDVDSELAQLEDETGFSVPDDIETMLGDNILLAVDSEGLTADAIDAEDPSQFNVGVRMRGDGDKLDDLSDRIMDLIEQASGTSLPVEKVAFDDGVAVGTNPDYAQTLADLDGGLGDSDQFQSVTDDAAGKEFVMYFDWDLIEDQVLQSLRDDQTPDDVIENLEPLRAFGVTTEVDGDYTQTVFRLSVND